MRRTKEEQEASTPAGISPAELTSCFAGFAG
jgi:hypothetical protein